jgi:hypothetical protein
MAVFRIRSVRANLVTAEVRESVWTIARNVVRDCLCAANVPQVRESVESMRPLAGSGPLPVAAVRDALIIALFWSHG